MAHEQIKKIGLVKIKNLATNKKNVKVLDIYPSLIENYFSIVNI